MIKLFGNQDPPISEEALRASARTACDLFYNSARHFGAHGFIGEQEHVAAEAFLCGAFAHLLNVACKIPEDVVLGQSAGQRTLLVLAATFVEQNPIFHMKAEGETETLGDVVDRFVGAMRSDPEAYTLGVQQARLLVLHFRNQAPEPSGLALPELLRSRKSIR